MPFKVCLKCGNNCGPRSLRCPKCQAIFSKKIFIKNAFKGKVQETKKVVALKKRRKKIKPVIPKWDELKKGDIIKISSTGGPIFKIEEEIIKMSYKGFFQVIRVEKNGILAIARQNNTSSGFCFIYMGKEKKSHTGTILRPHKILSCKQKIIET